jgi:hypothetical protein
MIRLFINRYKDSSPLRQAELDEALCRNFANPAFDCVQQLDGRPTFADFFAAAHPDSVTVIANSDIAFDASISLASDIGPDEAYALSRWDGDSIQNSDSQDVWIFRGVPKPGMFLDFTPGVCGCDNRLAWELMHAGYRVSNPSLSIKANHLHASGVRHYAPAAEYCVPRPYLLIKPHALGEQPLYREIQ